ncbi:MAG: hypothetical protein SVN78_01390 [Deferribacterota bacterium]|nr:hypothetical protein [Deferribacterota bacterium]
MMRVQDVPEVDRVIMSIVERDRQTRRTQQLKKRRVSPRGNKKRNKKSNVGSTIDYEG